MALIGIFANIYLIPTYHWLFLKFPGFSQDVVQEIRVRLVERLTPCIIAVCAHGPLKLHSLRFRTTNDAQFSITTNLEELTRVFFRTIHYLLDAGPLNAMRLGVRRSSAPPAHGRIIRFTQLDSPPAITREDIQENSLSHSLAHLHRSSFTTNFLNETLHQVHAQTWTYPPYARSSG